MIITFVIASVLAGLSLYLYEAFLMGMNPFLTQIGWGIIVLGLLARGFYILRTFKAPESWHHLGLAAGIFLVAWLVNFLTW